METIYRDYDNDNKLAYEIYYRDEKKYLTRSYHKNGALSEERPVLNGLALHGTIKHYYESGILAYESPYSHGQQFGRENSYREDGSLEYTAGWYDNEKHGICNKYDENGSLIMHKCYNKGEEICTLSLFYKDLTNFLTHKKHVLLEGEVTKFKFGDPYEL